MKALTKNIALCHIEGTEQALRAAKQHAQKLDEWGLELAEKLDAGRKILVAGNGGSAAEAQHFTAELVGRYREDRDAYSALALNAETSSVTAIGNDYGYAEVFARQIQAHGKPGDLLLLLSTSGQSPNLTRAAETAATKGLKVWAMTGAGPNPLQNMCDDHIGFDGPSPHVQECQLVALHAICEVFDDKIRSKQ